MINVGKDIIHESYTDSMNNTFTQKRIHVCEKVSQEALADLTADARIVVDRTQKPFLVGFEMFGKWQFTTVEPPVFLELV